MPQNVCIFVSPVKLPWWRRQLAKLRRFFFGPDWAALASLDGSRQHPFHRIQDAIDHAAEKFSDDSCVDVKISPGRYDEPVVVKRPYTNIIGGQ